MTDLSILLEGAHRGKRRVEGWQRGAAYRRDAGVEHNVVNAGSQPMSFH